MNPPADMETPGNIASATLDDAVQSAFGQPGAAFFADADIHQRLNLIRHLLQSTRLVVLVVGESGVGKSAALTQLERMADERWSLCRIAGAASAEPDKLLADLARCCDLPPDCGRLALRHLLAEHASALYRNTRLPVIVVDDAHALTQPALAELAALASPAEGWHLLLAGEPLDEGRLQQGGFPAAALHVLEWPHLSRSQTGAYLSHRLATAGWSETLPLPPEQLARLHRDGRGLPAEIDRLAPEMLARRKAAAPVTNQRLARPGGRLPLRKTVRILGLVLLIGVAAAVLTQQDRINALFEQQPRSASAPANPIAPPSQPTPAMPPATPSGTPEPETEPHGAGNGMPETVPEAEAGIEDREPPAPPDQDLKPISPSSRPPAAAIIPDNSSAQSTAPPPASPAQPGASDTPAAPAEPVAPRSPQSSGDAKRSASASPAESNSQPAADAASNPGTAERPAGAPESVPETPPAPLPAAEPDTAAAVPPQPSVDEATTPAPASNTAPDRQWLLSRPGSHYTLQLLGSREAKPLQELIDRFALKSDTASYKIQYRDADWYVLVHGDFADLGAARDAMAKLPEGLRRAGPWPRPFSAVQQEVRRGRK